jgi:hypothetical protein
VLHATAHHLLWNASAGRFTYANALKTGGRLAEPGGRLIAVSQTRHYRAYLTAYNLSISGIHTYYVYAGRLAVLVHNTNPQSCPVPTGPLPDDAVVVRGGTNTPDQIRTGTGVKVDAQGNVSGVSVRSNEGMTPADLAASGKPIPNGQIGVTTAGDIRAAGGQIVRDGWDGNPYHCTISGCSPDTLSRLFDQGPNPLKTPKP